MPTGWYSGINIVVIFTSQFMTPVIVILKRTEGYILYPKILWTRTEVPHWLTWTFTYGYLLF